MPYQTKDFLSIETKGPLFSLVNSILVPRPVAWITSIGSNGVVNLAPFSYFSLVCLDPLVVSVSVHRRGGVRKDTSANILFSKEFVIQICPFSMAKTVSLTGGDFPPSVSEVDLAGLSLLPSEKVAAPRIADTPIQMECKLYRALEVGNDRVDLLLGEVVKIHLHKGILDERGEVDMGKLNPLIRLCDSLYAEVGAMVNFPRSV